MIKDDHRPTSIRPEILAGKLAAIRNYEHPELLDQITRQPRLVELLWFIQWLSFQPGGLLKFAQDFVAEFSERIGTITMRAAKGPSYTLSQKLAIWNELPRKDRPSIEGARAEEAYLDSILTDSSTFLERQQLDEDERRRLNNHLKPLDREFFQKLCADAALDILPRYLDALCTDKGKSLKADATTASGSSDWNRAETWFADDIIALLLEYMDRHAQRVQQRLAMTEVAKTIFREMDYALAEKVMVQLEGNSRFGKTEAMETRCGMYPGIWRLVRVPRGNSLSDFIRRFAEAFGIDCSYGSRVDRLEERVKYIIQHSGLCLALDEGAWLLPENYSPLTRPKRIDWLRDQVLDRHLPLVIAAAPQFSEEVRRFVKRTGYNMAQWLGRTFLVKKLPHTLSEADLIAVARIHFPELDEDALGFIASEARLSQNYLQAVEATARRARFLSKQAGHRRVSFADVEAAVADVLPRAALTPESVQPVVAAQARGGKKPARKRTAGALKTPCRPDSAPVSQDETRRRILTPFDNRSLVPIAEPDAESALASA